MKPFGGNAVTWPLDGADQLAGTEIGPIVPPRASTAVTLPRPAPPPSGDAAVNFVKGPGHLGFSWNAAQGRGRPCNQTRRRGMRTEHLGRPSVRCLRKRKAKYRVSNESAGASPANPRSIPKLPCRHAFGTNGTYLWTNAPGAEGPPINNVRIGDGCIPRPPLDQRRRNA